MSIQSQMVKMIEQVQELHPEYEDAEAYAYLATLLYENMTYRQRLETRRELYELVRTPPPTRVYVANKRRTMY